MCCEIRSITDLLVPNAAKGKPPPIDLARQIMSGCDAEVFARAAPSELCTGFHFVEDQQRAVFVADLAQALQETRLRHAETDVHQDRLEDDRGDFTGIFFEPTLDGGEIVKGRNRARWRSQTFGTPRPPVTEVGSWMSP